MDNEEGCFRVRCGLDGVLGRRAWCLEAVRKLETRIGHRGDRSDKGRQWTVARSWGSHLII